MRKGILITVVALLSFFGAEMAASAPGNGVGARGTPPSHSHGRGRPAAPGQVKRSVPEIDAGAGGYVLALLGGVMLLVGERVRRRSV